MEYRKRSGQDALGFTPFQGTWTLRCQGCNNDFIVEVEPDKEIVDVVRNYPCPDCKKTPRDHDRPADLRKWHHVVNFHARASV